MSLKLKNFFNHSSFAGWLTLATLVSGSGCAKLAYDPNATEREAEKIKKAGVEVSPPSLNSPLIIAPVGKPTTPVSVESEPDAPSQPSSEDQLPTASTPAEAKTEEQAQTPVTPGSLEGAPSETPISIVEPEGEDPHASNPAPQGGQEPNSGSGSRGEEQSSQHASQNGQNHANEHAAHQRSRVMVSHSYARSFHALNELSLEEIKAALPKLPYISTREHPMVTLQIRRANDARLHPRPHVLNSQVLLGIDITELPDERQVPQVSNLTLSLSLTRVSIRNRADTELLCLLDIARCSGRAIQAASWQSNRNSSFWDAGNPVKSAIFADLKPGTDVPYTRTHSMNQGTLHLNLFELLGEDVLQAMRNLPLNEAGKRILLIAVGDDTLVHDAALTVYGTENSEVTIATEAPAQP